MSDVVGGTRTRVRVAGVIATAFAVGLLPIAAQAQLRSQVVVSSGLSSPVALVPDPAFANVMYVVEQGGLVKVLRDGILEATPFLDLRSLTSASGERGLLGMAFAPDASGRVFFNYTNLTGDTVVARYTRTPVNPLVADPATRLDLRWPSGDRVIRQPFANHNGGHLAFGPDGYLYIGLGDGGSGNDPNNNAQGPATLLGKMLRIDVGVADGDTTGYRVPAGNPFLDQQPITAMEEIWDVGLRNPWRYSFDDFGAGATGALIIGDVGQGSREEIDYEPRGAGGRNYGWRIREGRVATPNVQATTPAFVPLIDPIFDYGRSDGRAITGGYVYRGQALGSAYRGRYFFADSETARVWSLGLSVDAASGEAIVTNVIEHTAELGGTLGPIVSFGRDLQGELYLVSINGSIRKILLDTTTSNLPQSPTDLRAVVSGNTVTISWTPPATGAIPTSYQLEAGSSTGAANLAVVTAGAPQTSLTFPGIPPGSYFVRVRSVAASGVSLPSNEIVVVVGSSGCVGAPPSPTNPTSTVNGRTVTLAWNVPSTSDGPNTYVIEGGSATGLANLAMLILDGSARSFSVVAPPGIYFVRIRGRNACGVGPVSNEIVVTVF
jgi:glucose/arabinose dehydrogenase